MSEASALAAANALRMAASCRAQGERPNSAVAACMGVPRPRPRRGMEVSPHGVGVHVSAALSVEPATNGGRRVTVGGGAGAANRNAQGHGEPATASPRRRAAKLSVG